jgi:hypothetical protein
MCSEGWRFVEVAAAFGRPLPTLDAVAVAAPFWRHWGNSSTAAAPLDGSPRGPLIPPLMGPSTPPSMGPSEGEGPVGAGLGPFALVRRSAGQGHAQNPPVTLPRFAT